MGPTMASQSFRVGELSRRTGVTVRTLHHYDELGLLSPARRTGARHRLYGEADVVKLLRIRALVQIGFSLADVAALLRLAWAHDRPQVRSHCAARVRVRIRGGGGA